MIFALPPDSEQTLTKRQVGQKFTDIFSGVSMTSKNSFFHFRRLALAASFAFLSIAPYANAETNGQGETFTMDGAYRPNWTGRSVWSGPPNPIFDRMYMDSVQGVLKLVPEIFRRNPANPILIVSPSYVGTIWLNSPGMEQYWKLNQDRYSFSYDIEFRNNKQYELRVRGDICRGADSSWSFCAQPEFYRTATGDFSDAYNEQFNAALERFVAAYWPNDPYDQGSINTVEITEKDAQGRAASLSGKASFNSGRDRGQWVIAHLTNGQITCVGVQNGVCRNVPLTLDEAKQFRQAEVAKTNAQNQLNSCAQFDANIYGPGRDIYRETRTAEGRLLSSHYEGHDNGPPIAFRYHNRCSFNIRMYSFGGLMTDREIVELKPGQSAQIKSTVEKVERIK